MVTVKPFGTCSEGAVEVITLTHDGCQVEFLSFGAIVRALRVPDRSGRLTDVILGYDTLEDYFHNDTYLGACVGRCASRIAGTPCTLEGESLHLAVNEGENHLHGGQRGFDQRLWQYTTTAQSVTFHRLSPHMEEGYPGNLDVSVTYTLSGGTLHISYHATTDRTTLVNMTSHCYFNLAGQDSGSTADQVLSLQADFYTPCGAGCLVTGEICTVTDTPLDFRQPTVLGDRIGHPDFAATRGMDHNFVLGLPRKEPVARAYSTVSGICMDVSTDAPGIQLYAAGFLYPRIGKEGATYGPYHGFCLEAQHLPDAVHHTHFPSCTLHPGEVYTQETSYHFSILEK